MGEGLYKSRVRLTNETGFAEIDLWLAFLTAQRAGQVDLIQQSGEPRVGIPFRGVYRGLDEATAVTIANLPPRLTFNETDRSVTGTPTLAGTWENRILGSRDGATVAFATGEIRIEPASILFDGTGHTVALKGLPWEFGNSLSEEVLTETLPTGIERISSSQLYGVFPKAGRFEIPLTYIDGTTARAPAVVQVYELPDWSPERRRARVLPAKSLFDTTRMAVVERHSPFSPEVVLRTTNQAGDGTAWTSISLPPEPSIATISDIVRGNNFVLAGPNWWSVASTVTRFRELDTLHQELRTLAAEGPLTVAASAGLLSLEGGEWNLLPESSGQVMHSVAIGNGRIVDVGALGRIEVYSTDKTLIDKLQPVQATLKDVLFSEGEFIVVGDQGTVLRSPDGVSWELERVPTVLGANFRHITANKDWIVAVAPWTTLGKPRDGDTWIPLERVPVEGSYIDDLQTADGATVGGFATELYVPSRSNSSVTVLSSLCQAAIVGQPFDYHIGALAGNDVTYCAEGLPEGLVFDSTNGRIDGQFTQHGSYNTLVEASDGDSSHGKQLNIGAYNDLDKLLVDEIEVGPGTAELAVPTTFGTHVIQIEDSHEEGTRSIPVWLETGSGVHEDVVTVHVVAPKPTFLAQPGSVLASEGDRAVLKADIQGQWPIDLQWLHNGTALPEQKALTLVLPSLSPSQVGNYTLQASNALGLSTSAIAEIRLASADLDDHSKASVRLLRQDDTAFVLQIDIPPNWPDTSFTIQESTDLEDWTALSPLNQSTQSLETGRERIRWTLPTTEDGLRFVRLLLQGMPME